MSARPLDRRLAVAADHLVELVDALGGVDRQGPARAPGDLDAFAQELLAAGIDLGGMDDARETPAGMALGLANERECPLEPSAPAASSHLNFSSCRFSRCQRAEA